MHNFHVIIIAYFSYDDLPLTIFILNMFGVAP